MEALLASLGTLLVVAGYMLVKRLARSRCQVDSGCMQCDSPAVELAKKHTERLDEIFEMIKQVRPELREDPVLAQTEEWNPTTIEVAKEGSN